MIGNASMSPMPISIRGKSWPRASGWRATPSTVREDTSPSPTPAPIAPPAMIKPAATSPAPMMIACSTSSSLCDCRLPGFVVFHCLPEVRDREHSEDECLDRPDEDAEGDPDDVEDKDRDHPEDRECPDQDVAERSLQDLANAQQEASAEEREHEQHHLAGQDVAEEPEGERYRFRQLFDEVDRRENGKGLEDVLDSGRRLLRQSPTARPEYEASDNRQNNGDHDHRVDVDRQPEDLDLDVLADLDLGLSNQCQPGHRATLCRVDQTNETGTFMSNTRAMPMAKPP